METPGSVQAMNICCGVEGDYGVSGCSFVLYNSGKKLKNTLKQKGFLESKCEIGVPTSQNVTVIVSPIHTLSFHILTP